ncbi:MAG: HAMP domain-containing histidine kinase [Deltaproteobacteria bacterium]|nr:HAMP domain-containing histidine kinase [Deltaproteobacteria bacterium]
MRPGKLYIKIFLSFALVLIITEILVFALFIGTVGKTFRSQFMRYTEAKVIMAKELVEDKIQSEPDKPLTENEPLKGFILRFAETFHARAWLADPAGTPLIQSFEGDVSDILARVTEKCIKDFGDFKLYHPSKGHWGFYATTPIEIRSNETGSFHILFKEIEPTHHQGSFPLGLLVIGIVIALLVIPVSRFITKRVNRLRHSAVRIAEGDLSHRTAIKGKDEIGDLGRAFNRMAEKVERMIRGGRELTANVSHELRSPLARIRVAEELLRERVQRGEYKDLERHLNDIQGDIEELNSLIERILILSKMDIHEVPLKLERLDPVNLLKDLLKKMAPAINRKGIGLKTDLSFDPPFSADREALQRALTNLLENAVKFTPEKENMAVRMLSKEGSLEISMTNACPALPEEDLTRIFEPFYRSEQTSGPGSGLGLAITKKIVERHGGVIEALNTPQGLAFRITLPASPEE